jgi:molybdopterin/thiamine biosynthesis adenylyltransferase
MKRMAASDVLVVGLKGLGVEIGAALTTSSYQHSLIPHILQPRTSALLA